MRARIAATASAINLVDFIKPILMLVVLGLYLRVLGQIFEKDLRYFNLKVGLIDTQPRRAAIDDTADRAPVTLPERGHCEEFADSTA